MPSWYFTTQTPRVILESVRVTAQGVRTSKTSFSSTNLSFGRVTRSLKNDTLGSFFASFEKYWVLTRNISTSALSNNNLNNSNSSNKQKRGSQQKYILGTFSKYKGFQLSFQKLPGSKGGSCFGGIFIL